MTPTTAELDLDLWPRTPEYRFRLYALTDGARLQVLAACPTAAGIGNAILTLHEDEKAAGNRRGLPDRGAIGVLDVLPEGPPRAAGEWLINPFPRGVAR